MARRLMCYHAPMPHTTPSREEIREVLALVHAEAVEYLAGVDTRPARAAGAVEAGRRLDQPLPETGSCDVASRLAKDDAA